MTNGLNHGPVMVSAVFFDRDGVLNHALLRDGRPISPRTPAEFVLVEDAAAALALLRMHGFATFAVTNQPDLARGLLSAAALDAMHARLRIALPLDEIAVCAHDDADACACRKPRPGLLTGLAARHGLDLRRSFMVGDTWRDTGAGEAAGCRTLLLDRPYNAGVAAGLHAPDLLTAARLILDAAREEPAWTTSTNS